MRRAVKANVPRGIIVAITIKMLVQINSYRVCKHVWFAFLAYLKLTVTLRVLSTNVPSLATAYAAVVPMSFQVTLALPTGVQIRTRAWQVAALVDPII
jgi:hypothetical protein